MGAPGAVWNSGLPLIVNKGRVRKVSLPVMLSDVIAKYLYLAYHVIFNR